MPTLREFDLQCRGSAQVVEEWQQPRSEVRRLWRVDDLVSILSGAISTTVALYEQYCQEGSFPGLGSALQNEDGIPYFIKVAEKVIATAHTVEGIASQCERNDHPIQELNALRLQLSHLMQLLEDAEWREIELTAPTDAELERYAEEVRPPVDYYAD